MTNKAAADAVSGVLLGMAEQLNDARAENRELKRLLDESRAECNGLGCGRCVACYSNLASASRKLLGAAQMMLGKFQHMHDNDVLREVYEDPMESAIDLVRARLRD